MKKIFNKEKVPLFIRRSLPLTYVILALFFGINYYRDHFERFHYHYSKGGGTHWGEAYEQTHLTYLIIDYISKCKRIPDDFKDLYNDKYTGSLPSCKAFDDITKDPKMYPNKTEFPNYKPWIDPWGRPYQIRYDRENRKLQVRSQGRYLWTESDDIVGETTWGGIGNMMNEEIKKCDSLPKDDPSCIFNRGWH